MGASGALMGGSALFGAYSAKENQKSANMASEYNARMSERSAHMAEMQAGDALARGHQEEKTHLKDVRGLKSAQRTGFASSGVLVDQGSALDTLVDTQNQGERDALTIRHNAATEAWTLRENAKGMRQQAQMQRLQKRDPNAVFTQSLLSMGASQGGQYALAKGY